MTVGDFIQSTLSATIGTYVPTFHHAIVAAFHHFWHWIAGVCCGWAIAIVRNFRG